MISVMLGLLAGVADQPAIVRPPIMTAPMTYTAPLLPQPEGAVPAVRASANLPALFSTDDYPAAALRNGEQGTVSFAVAISSEGRVTHCSITNSSGSASLDVTTCSIIQRRARFALALEIDPAGIISKCEAANDGLNRKRVDDGCKDSRKGRFVALDPAAGNQSTRHAVRYWAGYTRPIE